MDLGGSKEPRASWEPGSLRGMGNHAMLSFGQISLTTYDLGLSRLHLRHYRISWNLTETVSFLDTVHLEFRNLEIGSAV